MRKPKGNDLADRRSAATDAKAALVQAHRAAEPTRLARQEERLATAKARDERRAEHAKAQREEQERIQAEESQHQAAADAAARAEVEASEKHLNDRARRVVEDEAARKAERDRRYANRKARQR